MFPRQNQNQFRNSNADVQIFYGDGLNTTNLYRYLKSWNKPVGVSHVYMMLIGSGGTANTTVGGGGSGAVTVWYGAAKNVPDCLYLFAGSEGSNAVNTYVWAKTSVAITTSNYILRAQSGNLDQSGSADVANQFTASGFYQSVTGQIGYDSSDPGASTTTFLSGGVNTGGGVPITANYGYSTKLNGFFQLQPIIVGLGGTVNLSVTKGKAGLGCGGSSDNSANTVGGQGLVLIASW